MKLRLTAFTLLATFLVGCSSTPSQKPEPVQITGEVKLPNGQPAKNVTISFFPTGPDQSQGAGVVGTGGKFTANLVPGKYTYSFEGNNLKAIPKKYHSNDAMHSVDIKSGGTALTIELKE